MLSYSVLSAQFRADVVQANAYYGVIFPHHKSFYYFLNGRVPAFELNVLKQTDMRDIWAKSHKFPRYGVSLFYTDFQNKAILGQAFAVAVYIKHPIFSRKFFALNYTLAAGPAFLNKPFDSQTNPYNVAIGSHFNAFIKPTFEAELKFGKTRFAVGTSLTHFSNGALKKPNSGINHVGIYVGVSHQICNKTEIDSAQISKKFQPANVYSLTFSGGAHQNILGGRMYPVASFVLDYERRTSIRRGFGFGLDNFYDSVNAEILPIDTIFGSTKGTPYYAGAHLTYNVYFGRMSVTYQVGGLFYGFPTQGEYIFSRFGLRYSILDRLYASVTLKNYFGVADFIEWGLGYRLIQTVDKQEEND